MAQVRFFNRETRSGAKEFRSDLRLVNEKGGEFVGGPSIDALKAELGDLIYQTDVGPALREGRCRSARPVPARFAFPDWRSGTGRCG